MGLDMYLMAKLHTCGREWEKEKLRKINKKIRKIIPDMFESDNLNTVEISFEVGYWRKANHIHKWFVVNAQEGEDNCKEHYVNKGQLEELLKLCRKILADKKLAKKELPTQSGFFFGETDYDKYYFASLKNTINIIEKCLKLPDYWTFEYCSSW